MIGIGIGVSWAKQAISVVTNLLVSFKARVASYPNSIFEAEPCLAGQLTELNRDGLLNSASLVITPNAYNEGVLYDVVPNTTLGDMNVVRATTGTIVNSAGLIQEVPYNLLTYSEQFDNAIWVKTSVTVTANTIISPDGTQDADTLETLTTGARHVNQGITITSGTAYTYSVFVKKGNKDFCQLLAVSGTEIAASTFDVLNGVVGSTASSTVTVVNTIQDYGNGWYRCSITFTPTTTASYGFRIYAANSAISVSTVAGSTINIWGAQLVTDSVAKDYFPTTTRLNIPRLDYTGSTCPSILIEPQRTNLFLNSVLTGTGTTPTSWSAGFTTGTSAPATSTMSTIGQAYTFTTSASRQVINQSLSYVSGTTYACSVYVENVTGTIPITEVLFFNGTGTHTFYKDGVLISSSTAVVSGSRYTAIFAATATLSQQVRVGNGCTTSTTGSIRLSMPQLEVGSTATSYIPTTTATVTRNADVISKTGISSLIGQTEGTIFIDCKDVKVGLSRLFEIFNLSNTGTNIFLNLSTSGAVQIILNGTTVNTAAGNVVDLDKVIFKYTADSIKLFNNGVLIGSYSGAVSFSNTLDTLAIGGTTYTTRTINGNINSSVIWKTALTDQECITLTTL